MAKTTLFRHWPTKAETAFDFVMHDRGFTPMRCAATTQSAGRAVAHRVVDFMSGGFAGHVVAALLLDMAADPVLAQRFRKGFVRVGQRTDMWAAQYHRRGGPDVLGIDEIPGARLVIHGESASR